MSPPFLRRLERLPGPNVLWAVLIALVPFVGACLPNSYVATVGEASLERRLVAGGVFGYAVAISILAVAYFDARVREAGGSMGVLISGRTATDLFAGYSSALGPLLLAAAFVIATVVRTVALADLKTGLAWLPISVMTNVPLMSAFWIYLVVLLGLRRLSRLTLSLDTFPEDPSLGLAPVGRLAYTAFWFFVAASLPILVVNAGYTVRLALTLGIFLIGLVIFFASIWGLHRQLVGARQEHIARARHLFAQVYEPIRSGSPEELERRANVVLAARAITEEARLIQRWPFDDRRFKEIAAIIGTIVMFTSTGIITRLVYENVIL